MITLLSNIAIIVVGATSILFALRNRGSAIGPHDRRAIIVISLCLILLATINILYAVLPSTKLVVAEIYLRVIIAVVWMLVIYKAIYSELKNKAARRELELKALNDVALAVGKSMDLKQILRDALSSVIKIANYELGFIYLLNKDDNILEIAAAHGEIPKDLANKLTVLKPGQEV